GPTFLSSLPISRSTCLRCVTRCVTVRTAIASSLTSTDAVTVSSPQSIERPDLATANFQNQGCAMTMLWNQRTIEIREPSLLRSTALYPRSGIVYAGFFVPQLNALRKEGSYRPFAELERLVGA